ncbi:MAG: hypothetical protein HOP15_04065 [Planctomycetes bacterium]|nr:hypothetical protein [Planctomycetota bacterium]
MTLDRDTRINVFDARDDSVTALPGSNTPDLFVREDFVAFTLPEDGALDLNGDGDTLDSSVLQLYDARTRAVANTGWVTRDVRSSGGWLGFHVNEREQGRADLDGQPGEGTAFVAIDPATGAERVPGIASTGFASPERETGRFLLQQSELVLGDLNGDGDALDLVPLLYDARRNSVHAPGLASSQPLVEVGPHVGIVVDERDHGAQDLDGDGLVSSGVLFVLTGSNAVALNLGFAGSWIGGHSSHLFAARSERGEDLNGDDDHDDQVLLDWSERTPSGRNARIVVGSIDGAFGEQTLVTLLEPFQGIDANQDGDREDAVLTAYDAGGGSVRSLGLGVVAAPAPLSFFGSTAVLVSEQAQGADLNLDGDLLDQVLHTLLQRID